MPSNNPVSQISQTVLLFELGAHKYSLPFHVVDEILPAVELLPVPGSHYAMEGLLDVRGEIIPVLALSTLLNAAPRPISYTDHLIILNLDTERFAIRVDRACELAHLSEPNSQSSLKIPFCGSLVAGIDRYNGDRVTALEPEGLSRMLKNNPTSHSAQSKGN
jgi:chemotaxis signal transduction protein